MSNILCDNSNSEVKFTPPDGMEFTIEGNCIILTKHKKSHIITAKMHNGTIIWTIKEIKD